jgi:hypothetical protein
VLVCASVLLSLLPAAPPASPVASALAPARGMLGRAVYAEVSFLLFSPTHKRTEGRAPCGALSLLQKDAALQGGFS